MFAGVRETSLYFDVDGVGLTFDGDGAPRQKPEAMIIHGGPGSDHSSLKPAFAPLAREMQLVYFDHRGQGRSERGDPSRYTLDENVEDMEALRRYLGLGPVVSIGTSYGGMVAMAHAARHPGAVAKLVLLVTASHGGLVERAQELVRERGSPAQQTMVARLLAGDLRTPDDVRDYYAVMGPLYARRHGQRPELVSGRAEPSPEPLRRAFGRDGFLRRFDLRPELPRITVPTLIVAGRHDWICPPEFSEEIHALIPGSRFEVFEDSSHSLRVDEPERLVATIRDFVLTP